MKSSLLPFVLCVVSSVSFVEARNDTTSPALTAAAQETLAALPVSFVENRGQLDPAVRFLARCGSITAFFTDQGFRLSLLGDSASEDVAGAHVFLTFEDSLADVALRGAGRRLAPVRSYRGNDPAAWVPAAPSWTGLRYEGLYSGVDLAVLERDGSLAYDLLLAPGADPERIVVRCEGVSALALDGEQLLLSTAAGPLLQTPPLAWQVGPEGERLPVSVNFRLLDEKRYGFAVDGLSAELPLVIDPGLTWGTALGGTFADRITSLVLAPDGDLLVTGSTGSPDFPTTPGAFQTSVLGFSDVFVARIDPVGGQLRFSTYLGGTDTVIFRPEVGEDLALAPDGSVVVVGTASSPDFPTTSGVAQPNAGGGSDAFVASFATDGTLQWSTRMGGSNNDEAHTVAVAADGTVTLAGHTFSNDLPTTPGAFDETFNSLFLSNDIFVCRLSADGTGVVWCTYVGGVLRDEARELLLHPDNSVTIGGLSGSVDFPVTPGVFDESYNGSSGTETDGVLLRLSATGSSLDFSTFLGSTEITEICGLARTAAGDLVVAGTTYGSDFPTTPGARQQAFGGGLTDGFVARLSADASTLQWSTYFGGQGDDSITSLALDAGEQPTVTGASGSPSLFHDLPPDLPGGGSGFGASAGGPLASGPAGPVGGGGFAPGGSPGQGSDLSLDGPSDAWLARLTPTGDSLVWGTYHGGTADEQGTVLVLDAFGDAWVAGLGDSRDLPTTEGAVDPSPNGSFDGFVAHFAVPPVFQLSLGAAARSPRLVLSGSFLPGTPWSLDLDGCPPGAPLLLLLGSGPVRPAALAAGTSFVQPIALTLPLVADAEGRCTLGGPHWPAPATQLVLQAWVAGSRVEPSNGVLLSSP